MPTYEYKCLDCKKHFDLFQSMTEAPKRKCPTCGGKVQRLIGSGAGIIFKGSGFYETDYKRKAPPPAPKTSEAKPVSDTKPATEPPKKPKEPAS